MANRPTHYVFRNPVASTIRPTISSDETLSILHEINASRPPEKRLPTELLLRVNEEVHKNALLEKIRATWTPVPDESVPYADIDSFGYGESPIRARLDLKTKRYYDPKEATTQTDPRSTIYDRMSVEHIFCHVSSANLLYRLRCYFPEIEINSDTDRYKSIWGSWIKHNQTGMSLELSEHKGAATFTAYREWKRKRDGEADDTQRMEPFAIDSHQLLNALFATYDGSRQLVYYHPAANGDLPTDDEYYIAVPREIGRKRCHREADPVQVYEQWQLGEVSIMDMSSFRSILQDLKYDIQSRKIDRLNGTAKLTTVISSPLLFYRLICKFMLGHKHVNVNQEPPIKSVWQVQLTHCATRSSIILMDDRGLFDIRVGPKVEEMMDDIEALLGSLCSDTCIHPYDGVVAGTVA